MPLGVQHLLGIVNFIDHDLAAVAREKVPPGLRRRLVARNIRLIELEADAERVRGRGMNFVTLEPGRVLMPAGCPALRARLEEAGARCDEVRIDQYLRAAGGVGCLTGILHRA
jgi:N-dimethylarginine dimethylaminohydrolase